MSNDHSKHTRFNIWQFLCVATIFGFASQFLFAAQGESKSVQAWEYKYIDLRTAQESLDDIFNQMGKEGWEMTGIQQGIASPKHLAEHDKNGANPAGYAIFPVYYFKRPLTK